MVEIGQYDVGEGLKRFNEFMSTPDISPQQAKLQARLKAMRQQALDSGVPPDRVDALMSDALENISDRVTIQSAIGEPLDEALDTAVKIERMKRLRSINKYTEDEALALAGIDAQQFYLAQERLLEQARKLDPNATVFDINDIDTIAEAGGDAAKYSKAKKTKLYTPAEARQIVDSDNPFASVTYETNKANRAKEAAAKAAAERAATEQAQREILSGTSDIAGPTGPNATVIEPTDKDIARLFEPPGTINNPNAGSSRFPGRDTSRTGTGRLKRNPRRSIDQGPSDAFERAVIEERTRKALQPQTFGDDLSVATRTDVPGTSATDINSPAPTSRVQTSTRKAQKRAEDYKRVTDAAAAAEAQKTADAIARKRLSIEARAGSTAGISDEQVVKIFDDIKANKGSFKDGAAVQAEVQKRISDIRKAQRKSLGANADLLTDTQVGQILEKAKTVTTEAGQRDQFVKQLVSDVSDRNTQSAFFDPAEREILQYYKRLIDAGDTEAANAFYIMENIDDLVKEAGAVQAGTAAGRARNTIVANQRPVAQAASQTPPPVPAAPGAVPLATPAASPTVSVTTDALAESARRTAQTQTKLAAGVDPQTGLLPGATSPAPPPVPAAPGAVQIPQASAVTPPPVPPAPQKAAAASQAATPSPQVAASKPPAQLGNVYTPGVGGKPGGLTQQTTGLGAAQQGAPPIPKGQEGLGQWVLTKAGWVWSKTPSTVKTALGVAGGLTLYDLLGRRAVPFLEENTISRPPTPDIAPSTPEQLTDEEEERLRNTGGVNNPPPQARAKGGIIYANNGALVSAQSRGTDTVPAMLTPGEFVINRVATEQNRPLLEAINSGQFNSGGLVNYLARGGYVTPQRLQNGGQAQQVVQQTQSVSSGVNNVSMERPSWVDEVINAFNSVGPAIMEASSSIGLSAEQLANSVPSSVDINQNVNVQGSVGLDSQTLGRAVAMGSQQAGGYTDQKFNSMLSKLQNDTDGGVSFSA